MGICVSCALILVSVLGYSHIRQATWQNNQKSIQLNTVHTGFIGEAKGIFPGRVVWCHNPDATSWDGVSGRWWYYENTDQAIVDQMLSQSIQELAGAATNSEAWDNIFKHFNKTKFNIDSGYKKGEKIAIKLNLNGSSSAKPGNGSFTSPHLVYALLRQLVNDAGVSPEHITVYDVTRMIPDCIYDLCSKGELAGIHFVDYYGRNGREAYKRNNNARINWSYDVEGNPAYLPTCVTDAKYLINLASLKGHTLAGVTLTAKNHFGSFCSDLNGAPTNLAPQGANLHGFIAAHDFSTGDPDWTWSGRPEGTYNPLVDLMGHPDLGGKTILYMLDALYVARDQSSEIDINSKWISSPFNGHWTSSIFVSQDGVAIDSVGLDFIYSEPTLAAAIPEGSTAENYLHEAAQAGDPPSGTIYDPDNDGIRLQSLGVHEHWNNATDKMYSGNLGNGAGIELIKLSGSDLQLSQVILMTDGNILPAEPSAVFTDSDIKLSVTGKSASGKNINIPEANIIFKSDKEGILKISSDGTVTVLNKPALNDTVYIWAEVRSGTKTIVSNTVSVNIKHFADSVLLARGSNWKYIDDGLDQGTAWRNADFDDSTWKTGPAPLGYPSDKVWPTLGNVATEIGYGPDPNEKYATYYFRTTFSLNDLSGLGDQGQILLGIDGGVVLYLNGHEIGRFNLPEGEIPFDKYISDYGLPNPGNAQYEKFTLNMTDLSHLVEGENVLAAEVHQYNKSDNDIYWDMEFIVRKEKDLLDIEVTLPDKIVYKQGETNVLDTTGMKVYKIKPDGSKEEISLENITISGFSTQTTGTKEIKISYTSDNVTYMKTFEVNVIESDDTFTVSSGVFKDLLGQTVTELTPGSVLYSSVNITNNTSESKQATIIIGLYDGNGSLKSYSSAQKNIMSGVTEELTAGLSIPEDINGYYIKMFVWDSMDTKTGMHPLSNAVVFPS